MTIRTFKSLQVGRKDTGIFSADRGASVQIKVKGVTMWSATDTAVTGFSTDSTAQTVTGLKTFSTMFRIKRSAVVAAAGTDNTNAAALSEGFQTVSGANGTVGVILPAAGVGAIVIVKGVTAGVLKVYPDEGAAINDLTATTGAISLASGKIPVIFIKDTATQWYTIPLVPS